MMLRSTLLFSAVALLSTIQFVQLEEVKLNNVLVRPSTNSSVVFPTAVNASLTVPASVNASANPASISASVALPDPVNASVLASAVPVNTSATVFEQKVSQNETERWEEWKKLMHYLPSFDVNITSMPDIQREFINGRVSKDNELFREILREAINKRNSFAPSVSLLWKYSTKLLSNFIHTRRSEQQISPRLEPKPAFFLQLANLTESVIKRSGELKKEKNYTKKGIDTDDLYNRVDALLRYIQKTIELSPVGTYLKWNELVLYKNETTNPHHDKQFVEEAGDLLAQFRAMGYETTIFFAKRIVNMLKMFAKGFIPSEKEV